MNGDIREILIGLEWIGFFLGFMLFGLGVVKIARQNDSPLFRWPVRGRWLLAGFLFSFALVCLDIARLRFEVEALEPIVPSKDAVAATSWVVFAIRTPALVLLFWTVWRLTHGGLVTSVPEREWQPGDPDRRSGIERRKATQ